MANKAKSNPHTAIDYNVRLPHHAPIATQTTRSETPTRAPARQQRTGEVVVVGVAGAVGEAGEHKAEGHRAGGPEQEHQAVVGGASLALVADPEVVLPARAADVTLVSLGTGRVA